MCRGNSHINVGKLYFRCTAMVNSNNSNCYHVPRELFQHCFLKPAAATSIPACPPPTIMRSALFMCDMVAISPWAVYILLFVLFSIAYIRN